MCKNKYQAKIKTNFNYLGKIHYLNNLCCNKFPINIFKLI